MNTDHDDLFLHRAMEARHGDADWASFEARAALHPQLWEQFARAQRDDRLLGAEVAEVLTGAAVELPGPRPRAHRALPGRWATWSGWAAAAAIALLWAGGFAPGSSDDAAPLSAGGEAAAAASLAGLSDADSALADYLQRGRAEGRVVKEMPMILLQAVPLEDGGHQVLFLRQIVERHTVEQLYEYETDELGRPVPVELKHVTPVSLRPL
ncbi:MAG TPA: hypothetical protein VGC54_11630 [Planctomycetota bacterium]